MESTHQIPQPDSTSAFPEKVPLFTPNQIGAAAFFGTLVASAWLARNNFIAMGDKARGDKALLAGVVVTMALMALAFVLPDGTPSVIFTIPQIVLALQLGKKYFEHRMITADRLSNWKVAGVCALTLVLVIAVLFGVVMALDITGLVPIEPLE
jgi:NAD/NADP transhydrogenase beta subunit